MEKAEYRGVNGIARKVKSQNLGAGGGSHERSLKALLA